MTMETADMVAAMVGNRGHIEPGIGFEQVGRGVRLLLARDLNDEIDRQQQRWLDADIKLEQLGLDPGVGQVAVQHVPIENLHEGPHRSFIEAPPEAFPNVSIMAYMTTPSANQFADQIDSSDITLFVESMAISGPVADDDNAKVIHETRVHRRIQRMTEAVALVIARNPTLLGSAHSLQLPPRGGIGNSSWLRREGKGAGPNHIWHGSRLQYTLQRHHHAF